MLEILCRKIKQNKDIDLDRIVLNTPGYVGADLNALIDEALISSLDRRLDAQIRGENASREEDSTLVLNCNFNFYLNYSVKNIFYIYWAIEYFLETKRE